MSGGLVVLVLAAVAFAGFGMYVLSLHLDRFPLDQRRPDSLVSSRWRRTQEMPSPELRRLRAVIANAASGERSARAELERVLASLGVSDGLGQPGVGLGDRGRWGATLGHLEAVIAELEAQVDQPSGPSSPVP